MISPEEVKQQALRWWKPLLQHHPHGESFFPRQVDRIGKVQSADVTTRFEALQNEIELLYASSKNENGIGYLVKTSGRNFRRTGNHELPDSIEFETIDDYLHTTGKKKEWKLFKQNYEFLVGSLPQLKEWIVDNVLLLTSPDTHWEGILLVCEYLMKTPRPNLYIRQLPIKVHTKFIEQNNTLLQSMLNFLIPDHIRNKEQRRFADRYFLNHDEPLIRIRILDDKLKIYGNINDLSIRLSDFELIDLGCSRVLITENKMNFLTLPELPTAIAIWSGGGFNVSFLKNVNWLRMKSIYYWGDIDEHGFQILHQMRSHYSQTQSVMMDRETFDTFQHFAVDSERSTAVQLHFLNQEESELYQSLKLKESKNRLEQEKIFQDYANSILNSLPK
ncbi:MAG: Wadjet anti-phage system protein JetD domain-containing protein [Cyclobacteriaceae bacterium]